MEAGLFVTFEGPEGAGKSLQARLLRERLQEHGHRYTFTREPGGTPLGDRVRELVLLGHDLCTGAAAEALLMCASRAQLVAEVIRPALARGEVVVCDRFGASTLAYQGYGRGIDVSALGEVVTFATGGLQPDLIVLLDLPVAQGLARKRAQAATKAPEWNRFEAEELAFHERVRDGYRALAAAEPARWRCLDASRPPEVLHQEVWTLLAARLQLGG